MPNPMNDGDGGDDDDDRSAYSRKMRRGAARKPTPAIDPEATVQALAEALEFAMLGERLRLAQHACDSAWEAFKAARPKDMHTVDAQKLPEWKTYRSADRNALEARQALEQRLREPRPIIAIPEVVPPREDPPR